MDNLFADIDAVVAIHLSDLVEADDKGTMNAHELLSGQHLFDGLHREMGDQWTALTVEVEHHIVLHATDVDDVADGNLTIFAIDLEENGTSPYPSKGGEGLRTTLYVLYTLPGRHSSPLGRSGEVPLLRLVDCSKELIISNGLQEEIEGTYLVTLEGIFLKGGGEDDTRFRGYHVGELHTVEIGHLDIKEEQIGLLFLYGIDGFDGVGEGCQMRQIRRLGNKRLQEFHGQRLVIDDNTREGHFCLQFTVYSLQMISFEGDADVVEVVLKGLIPGIAARVDEIEATTGIL